MHILTEIQCEMENYMRKKGWILLLVLLGVAFLMKLRQRYGAGMKQKGNW